MIRLSLAVALAVATAVPASVPLAGQAARMEGTASAAPVFGGPNVGDVAPDFTFDGVTRYGFLRDPLKLSNFRGQTVVLAFFPGARTPGCTIQMTKFRDEYAALFPDSAKVVVLAMSVDPDTTLAAWAREAHFPMLFASDAGGSARGAVGMRYGAYNGTYKIEQRLLYVIGPDGKVAYAAKPFTVNRAESFAALQAAVAKAAGTAP